ncbi:type II toxin-antitoxin system RelE/ParE family toxin [Flavobacterium sp. MAHUQ-51]|uniref:type II toxin-antitoxin system RelE/ParE family toxin n=1 Tax=Flavobacterium sp. GCM10022190 TaxID=3252639 RepID=UPI0036212934
MRIIWTKTSELTLDEILNYIESKFGKLISEKYFSEVIKTVEKIGIQPEMFPIYHKDTEVRKAVIKKKSILYYKISEGTICLLAFYDVRMNIHKL